MEKITDFTKLNPEQKQFIFLGLALKRPLPDIKRDFTQLFTEIGGEVLIQVENRYQKEIDKISKKELENVNSCPLSHARIRMEFIYKGLQEASTPKAIRSVRIGQNEWETIMEVDHASIIKYLQLARDEQFLAQRLFLDVMKNKEIMGDSKPTTGFKPIEINSGLNWEDEEVKVD